MKHVIEDSPGPGGRTGRGTSAGHKTLDLGESDIWDHGIKVFHMMGHGIKIHSWENGNLIPARIGRQWDSKKNSKYIQVRYMVEGSLEDKLPRISTDGKAEVGRVREEKGRSEKIRERKESEERRCRCTKR